MTIRTLGRMRAAKGPPPGTFGVVGSAILVFWLTAAQAGVTFSRASPISLNAAASDGVQAVAVTDLNGDGWADVIVTQPNRDAVDVYLNDGRGNFPSSPLVLSTPIDGNPVAVTTGDFDHDGHVDIAVVNNHADSVTVYYGDGNGGFLDAHDWEVDASPVGVVARDFNNDGRDDLAVLSDQSIRLKQGNADRSFSDFNPASISTGPARSGAFAIAAGHLNDAHSYVSDLAVSSRSSISVFFSNGDGTFQAPFFPSGFSTPRGLVIGEFDGDSLGDIAVITGVDVDTTVTLLVGNGHGLFIPQDTSSVQASAECGSTAIVAVDLDGDAKTDLAVGSTGDPCGVSGQIQLFCQEPSTLCFQSTSPIPVVPAPGTGVGGGNGFQIQLIASALSGGVTALQSGDINHDGKPDLIALQSSDLQAIKILLNTTAPVVPTATPSASPTPTTILPTPTAIAAEDGDGCALTATERGAGRWLLLGALVVWLRRRRDGRT